MKVSDRRSRIEIKTTRIVHFRTSDLLAIAKPYSLSKKSSIKLKSFERNSKHLP